MFAGLKEETVALARALGPALAGQVVADLIDLELDAELTSQGQERAAVRAAHLAGALGLDRAAPPLARCIESPGWDEALRPAAIVVLTRLAARGVDALLAAFHASSDVGARCRLADALARSPLEDARVGAALLELLRDAPAHAAWCLAERGEWRAVPDLIGAFDRLAEHPIADCDECAVGHLSAIGLAVRMLGGAFSPDRQAKVTAFADRARRTSLPLALAHAGAGAGDGDGVGGPPWPADGEELPGRNDACPCGSGQNYEGCCGGLVGRPRSPPRAH